jgi:pilus assembly protein CpaB
MVGFAVLFGCIAVFAGRAWLDRQASLQEAELAKQSKPAVTRTLVVAAGPVRYGNELGPKNLREMPWPGDAMPAGSYKTIKELLADGRRVALSAMEENEPVLAAKITGPGQRATLSSLVREGMKAVTIRVNDVVGVAGFVLPGDHVDVVLTRQPDPATGFAETLLQNVRVLGVDQFADQQSDKPAVARAVTIEVSPEDAQKVTLAANVGSLSLALRRAGEVATAPSRRITVSDLNGASQNVDTTTTSAVAAVPRANLSTTITVTRATKKQDYSVPIDAAN